ncbi:RagB/SusD family nutrient uptake outer membrane protein [Bacteroides uniformis]|uniref:RagB/SusD family nutrient uptake outer membrane protein n=1 Tax=Bacteroides uniformis TaxID=820 RepID=UPI001FAF36D1|nr:RagB/SusD family nutrient uptake outer membrane protein [Bacteroides uniformis]
MNYGYASVGGWRRISPKLYSEIPASDVAGMVPEREGVSANLPAAAQTYITGKKAPAYTQVKYGVLNDQWGTDNNATDIILMRVEEMYLIKAEAQAMSGNVSGGVSTLTRLLLHIVTRLISVQPLHRKLCRKLFGTTSS